MGRIDLNVSTQPSTAADFCLPVEISGDSAQATLKIEEQIIELFDKLRSSVYRYLICVHHPPEEADEVIQETFLKLYVHLNRGARIENARGWVFRVAHNLGVNRMKSRKFMAPMTSEQWDNVVETRCDPEPGPEEQLLHKERMTRLYSTISTLPPLQQQCLHLRIEGFRYREIGEILDVSVPTVSESLRRAIEKLTPERHG
jgi:RNA polymerase sigma-70 factor (ECF subfamily)